MGNPVTDNGRAQQADNNDRNIQKMKMHLDPSLPVVDAPVPEVPPPEVFATNIVTGKVVPIAKMYLPMHPLVIGPAANGHTARTSIARGHYCSTAQT